MNDNELDSAVAQLETGLAVNKAHIEQAACIERLEKNEDFIKMFVDGYGGEEIVRIVKLKASIPLDEQLKHADCMQAIDSMGHFLEYMRIVKARAYMASMSIGEYEERLEEARNPEAYALAHEDFDEQDAE